MTFNIIDKKRANEEREYVSFSEIYTFFTCPYKHDLNYNQGIRDEFSFYTVYGTAIHEAIERAWKLKEPMAWLRMGKIINLIAKYYVEEDGEVLKSGKKNGKYRGKNAAKWTSSALRIYRDFFPWMKENFADCALYDMEMELSEEIEGSEKYFKGFIDLILYNEKEDIYHIIDLKTSGWGWNSDQLADTKKLYQVTLYKYFFCKKLGIPQEKVKTHYLLLLRDPPKRMKHAMTLHSMTSGNKKISNAVKWMESTLRLVKSGIKLKKPDTCSFCVCGAKKFRPRKRR